MKAIQCDNNKVYTQCGSNCQHTCSSINRNNQTCADHSCIEGCFCPVGMVLDQNENCIEPAKCPCQVNGINYYEGQIINKVSPCEVW